MGRYQRILYFERRARGSARAFSCAVDTAVRQGASLTLAGAAAKDRLDRMVELAGLFELPVARLPSGRGQGLRAALAGEHDLVITVGRARGAGGPFRLGSVERALVRECESPVWILHPAQSPETRVVVAAVDVSTSAGDRLNREVVETAMVLAADLGAELHVAHCWSVVGESLLASRNRGGSPGAAERVLTAAVRERRRRVEALLEAVGGVANVVLCKGKVVSGLREVAWRLEADILVVGNAGRKGLGALFPGNAVERLMGRVPASLFVVRDGGGAGGAVDAAIRGTDTLSTARPGPRRPRQPNGRGRLRAS
jgi:nucleotide-binding universal stress UspA family protein